MLAETVIEKVIQECVERTLALSSRLLFCYYPFDAIFKCQINQPPVQRSPEVQDTIGISLVQAYRAYLQSTVMYS